MVFLHNADERYLSDRTIGELEEMLEERRLRRPSAWNSYSVAHWEGAMLVVESSGYRDDSWLDTSGDVFCSQVRVTERIRRPNFGSLNIDVSIDAPKVFTKTCTVEPHLKAMVDTEMIEYNVPRRQQGHSTLCRQRKMCLTGVVLCGH